MSKINKNIPVAGPWITEKEISYVMDAVTNGWYENANDYINRFEEAFKNYLGSKHAISLPSCTAGLHLSLMALGVKLGDEVIVPDATWIASAAPITYVGATPVFVDIDPKTWCLSAESVEPYINHKTKAIIAVNLYGHMPEYDALLKLAAKHNISVIEDAAESIGSKYKGRLSGTFGITSCFSFHGSKTLATGEGGMLVTNDDSIYEKCMILRDHGRLPGDIMFQNVQVGYKYKMSALQAALGLAQLERIEELVNKKREIFKWYQESFAEIPGISLNPDHPDVENSYWMSTVVFNGKLKASKREIIEKLKDRKIYTRPFFDPLSSLNAYKNYADQERAKKNNIHAYTISRDAINLPSNGILTKEEVSFVKNNIQELISA